MKLQNTVMSKVLIYPTLQSTILLALRRYSPTISSIVYSIAVKVFSCLGRNYTC